MLEMITKNCSQHFQIAAKVHLQSKMTIYIAFLVRKFQLQLNNGKKNFEINTW